MRRGHAMLLNESIRSEIYRWTVEAPQLAKRGQCLSDGPAVYGALALGDARYIQIDRNKRCLIGGGFRGSNANTGNRTSAIIQPEMFSLKRIARQRYFAI